jgi:alpha-glucosidase
MFGVDTCGFNGNTDEELCNRWMQLSAFFPFYRNHNVVGAISQEPYIWSSVAEASKTAMAIRYSLLPYIYTLFYKAHTTGSTVMRAMAWEFPTDPSLANADRQFLLGPSIMVTPVLEQGASSVNGVFPGLAQGEIWYDWYTQSAITGVSPGQNVTIPAPLGHIPVYVRGGSVLPMQEPGYTTQASRNNPWGVLVALNKEGTASGSLYVDDGQSLRPNATLEVEFVVADSALYSSTRGTYVDTNAMANVTVLGVGAAPSTVTLSGQSVQSHASYNSSSRVLRLTGLNNFTINGAWAQDWVLKWG